jgi:hypothetical protein
VRRGGGSSSAARRGGRARRRAGGLGGFIVDDSGEDVEEEGAGKAGDQALPITIRLVPHLARRAPRPDDDDDAYALGDDSGSDEEGWRGCVV